MVEKETEARLSECKGGPICTGHRKSRDEQWPVTKVTLTTKEDSLPATSESWIFFLLPNLLTSTSSSSSIRVKAMCVSFAGPSFQLQLAQSTQKRERKRLFGSLCKVKSV